MTIQHFSRLNANLPMRSGSAAIPERVWHDAATMEPIADDADVWLGMDFGWQWDTTALVPFWWRDPEFRLLGPAVIITPPRDGSHTDPAVVKQEIVSLCARYRVSTVVMDPDRAQDIAGWMSDELGLTVVERAQTSKPQGEDYERFMEALRGGWLRHSGDDGLRQHALNAVARLLPDGGAKFGRVSETRQGGNQDARVIDALVAAAMVHSYAVEKHDQPAPFVGVAWA
jgi:phage terminase large subunit-like protein